MISSLQIFLNSYASIFFIFNAFVNIFIIISFTPHMNLKQRLNTVKKSIFVATAAVIMFSIVGQLMLDGLKVTMAAMKFTGAILVGPAAYNMVVGHTIDNDGEHKGDLHFFPIGVPTLAGPGVFTAILTIIKQEGANGLIPSSLGVVAAIISVYVVLNIGCRLFSKISPTYMRMMSIFFGTILLALSAQFFIDGFSMMCKCI
ncbi:MarC family protein [Candidatus Cytomitobacter indipagum]|uniref:UPF0056 membrane protein n=1 Tax=Candidatus Cytomitobacter indipagum TaxID=2601575 RepID=A0A5C0UE10_9PROT|nr:MarC family protein [Candidatus Cytomitobacter indipagum]QEK37921.1 MarC family protein [Candidatus Cytomitobacter indipagum]